MSDSGKRKRENSKVLEVKRKQCRNINMAELLPNEIWLLVFSFLSVEDKCRVAMCNKHLNTLIGTSTLWTTIDLSHLNIFNIEIKWPMMRHYFTDSLRSLHLGYYHFSSRRFLSGGVLKYISDLCKNLRELSLSGFNLNGLSSAAIPKSVTTLRFNKCSLNDKSRHKNWFRPANKANNLCNLRTLKMRYVDFDIQRFNLGFQMRNLETLSLVSTPRAVNWSSEQYMKLATMRVNNVMSYFGLLCRKLITLELNNFPIDDAGLQILGREMKGSLKHLTVMKCPKVTRVGVDDLRKVLSQTTLITDV